MVGGSGVVNGGVVDGSVVDNGGGVVHGSVVDGGMVDNGGSYNRLVGRSGGRLVGRGRGRLVGRFGCRGIGLSLGVDWLSLVLNIGNISFRASTVGNNLYSAIRKVDSVFSGGVVVASLLLLGENGSVVGIVDSILVVVVDGSGWVGVSIGSRGSVGSWASARGYTHEGSEQNLGCHVG